MPHHDMHTSFDIHWICAIYCPVDTGRTLNVRKTFRIRPGRLLNVLCVFHLRPVSTGLYNFPNFRTFIWKKNSLNVTYTLSWITALFYLPNILFNNCILSIIIARWRLWLYLETIWRLYFHSDLSTLSNGPPTDHSLILHTYFT